MGRKLYVGNLPFSATEDDLIEKFSPFGRVESAKLITDRDTGRSKGFGFVEMSSDSEAQAAIDKLNGADYSGRPMTAAAARAEAATAATAGKSRIHDDQTFLTFEVRVPVGPSGRRGNRTGHVSMQCSSFPRLGPFLARRAPSADDGASVPDAACRNRTGPR
jgi:hypothetical protein